MLVILKNKNFERISLEFLQKKLKKFNFGKKTFVT